MIRPPSVRPKQVVRALKKAGFVEHHQRGSHLYLWHPQKERMTSVAMHAADLPRGTTKAILKQAGLTEEEFIELL